MEITPFGPTGIELISATRSLTIMIIHDPAKTTIAGKRLFNRDNSDL